MKIKITTGFRENQIHSIDMEEAHKVYFIFLNPNERGVFNNGLALRGQDIREIEPDYQGTMGWNPTHELDSDDWNEIRGRGVDRKMRELMFQAKEIAKLENPPNKVFDKPLSEVIYLVPKYEDKQIGSGMQRIGDFIGT